VLLVLVLAHWRGSASALLTRMAGGTPVPEGHA
jgi:hypothetical protein